MALLIRADGPTITITPKGVQFTLEELQALVHGYIEHVSLDYYDVHVHQPLDMLVNEDGLSMQLPINEAASALAWREIVGDVVVLRRDEWD